MSKKGKKASNKRGKNSAKSTKTQHAKQPRMEPPSVPVQRVQPLEVNPRYDTGSSYPKLEQLTSAQKSEFFSRQTLPGTSILATYLSVDPGVSLRDLELGPCNLSRDSGAGPSAMPRDSGAGQSAYSRDSGAGPSAYSRDSGACPSAYSRDSGAGPSAYSRDSGAGPSAYSRDSGAGPSAHSRDSGAGPSAYSRDSGAGPSAYSRDSGACPSAYSRDSGAGPSAYFRDSGAGPSTFPIELGPDPRTYSPEPEDEPIDLSMNSEEEPINLSKDSGAGPSSWSRDSGAGQSTWTRDLRAEHIAYLSESGTDPSTWSRDVGADPSIILSDSGADPSTWSRDLGAGPSTMYSDSVAGPGTWIIDSGAGPSTMTSDPGAGPSTWLRDYGAGPSTIVSDSGAVPSTWYRDPEAGPSTVVSVSEAGPSTWLRDSGAGPSTQPEGITIGPIIVDKDMYSDENLRRSIVSKFLGVPKSMQPENYDVEATLNEMYPKKPKLPTEEHENDKKTIKDNSDNAQQSATSPKKDNSDNAQMSATSPNKDNSDSAQMSATSPKKDNSDSAQKSATSPKKDNSDSAQKSATSPKKDNSDNAQNSATSPNKDNSGNIPKSETSSRTLKKPGTKLKRKISPPDEPQASTSKQECQVSTSYLDKPNGIQISQISSSISEKACGRVQEKVVSSSDVETLADSVQKCEISTADIIEIRHVQDIERDILQMDIIRESNNSPDFGRQYIQRLAASLLAGEAPIVLHDYRPRAAWPKKKSRVPFVFLHPPFEFRNHMGRVLARNIQFYHPQKGTHYTKILCPSFEDQQNLAKYFDDNQMPYHTYGHPSEKMTRVVIRGLTGEIDLVKLKDELIAASIPIVRLHKMRYNGMHKNRWHIILAIVPHSEEGLRLLTVSKIFGQVVTMEPAKSKAKQCHRCQRWGHAQRFCRGRVKCVKCAGPHFSDQCTRDPLEELPLCANCGGNHPASYRQCFHCPDSIVYKSWQKKKAYNQKLPWVLATSENCNMDYVYDRVDNMSVE